MSEEVEITFLGGAKQVGRSCFLVSSQKGNFLLDSGVNLGESEEGKYPLDPPVKPDYIILTHAHLDHSGYVPAILSKYRCKLICTPPTQDITEILATDNLKITKETGETVPYNMNDVMLIRKNSFDAYFKVRYKLRNDITVTFYNAGHIIGSSMVKLTIGEKTIFYTGDISTRHTRTLEMADFKAEGGDVVIMESTYGSPEDKHPSAQKTERQLISDLNKTIKNNGKVLIPVFAVGRAQEVMITIDDYMRSGKLATAPVFIDGLIIRINELYKLFWEWLKPEIQKRIRYTRQSPLDSDMFYLVKDRESVCQMPEPNIIITTSGMLEGGPSIYYLKRLAESENNMIYLTGYQVEGTRGRMLLEGAKQIKLPQEELIDVNAKVCFADFSAHADQPGLINFITQLTNKNTILCVHGEEAKTIKLSEKLSQIKGVSAYSPSVGETIRV